MKVILAGISKTGTKSMVLALKEFGYNVHDYLEHYMFNGDAWINIAYNGGSIEDFRRMYQGVDAVVDTPVWHFWEELHMAFPDAKIILTVRDSEEQWFQSMKKQLDTFNTPILSLMPYLSPTYRKLYNYGQVLGTAVYGIYNRSYFRIDSPNELLLKMTYRRHNTYVMETAPKNQLLVYNVKDGWEPLCKFLNLDIPDKPFPHENIAGNLTEKMMQTNPFFIRMQREMLASSLLICAALSFGCYKLYKSPSSLFDQIIEKSCKLLDTAINMTGLKST